jgi:DNA-binding YbaB/EbfC family protein
VSDFDDEFDEEFVLLGLDDDDDLPVLMGFGDDDDDAMLGGMGGGLGGLLGGGGDLGGLLGRAQQAMAEAQEAALEMFEGTAGNGLVRVSVNGGFDFSKVTIDPSAVDAADIELLEDLVLAALKDASAKIQARQVEIQQQMMGGFGGLGNLFGGA